MLVWRNWQRSAPMRRLGVQIFLPAPNCYKRFCCSKNRGWSNGSCYNSLKNLCPYGRRKVCIGLLNFPLFFVFVAEWLGNGLQNRFTPVRIRPNTPYHASLSLTGRAHDCSVEIRVQIPRGAPLNF